MAWRHWFIRHREIINDVNNEAPIINSSTANELLAWSLEPRMLFDGAIAATVHETATAEAAHTETAVSGSDAKTVTQSDASLALTHSVAKENNSVTPANHDATATAQPNASNATDIAAPAPDTSRHEVVFIDTSIKDYQTLAAGVGPGIDVVLVDGNKDGLQQIAEWAAGHGGYDAMHIFSHGSEGKINLGSGVLNSTTLSTDAVQTALAVIGKALTRDGDILLYGCDVGANSSGDALLAGIARATGADVAVSSNATGSSLMGGDWTLEKNVGTVDALALHVDAYHDLLTQVTFTSSDPDMDYTHDSVTRPVEGYNITFATSPGGFLGADSSYGNEGLYAYSGVDSVTRLTISSPVGTTFDLNSMNVGATTGTLHFSVQYGNGTTSSFDVAVSSSGYSTLSSFPSALNDITSVTITSQDFSAFESITITDVKASVTSAAPVIGNLNGDSVSFTEGGAPVLLDAGSNATLTDSDSADFNGGNVTVSFSGNGVSGQDVLSVQNQGTSAGQIGLSGTSVTWGGVSIGTLSGGTNGNSLVITLNASATPAAVQGLLHALTWQNTNNSEPSTLTRSISVTVNDGDGATSVASTVSVNVTGVNDAPTLTTTTSTPTFTENGNAVPLFSGSVVSTVESGQSIDQLTLTVSNISNGASEILTVDGTAIALTNGVSGNTLTNGIAYSVSVSGGTATLTLSSAAGISTSTTASLINGITYRNSSEAPTAANRVVTLTGVRDNGGTSNGGVNTTVLSFASTVSVEAVNDAPSISGPTTISVTEDTSKSLTGITFSDVDAGNATVAAAFSVNSGTLSAVSSAGVIVGTSGSTLLTLSGTIADINAFIAAGKLSFLPASNSTTSATLNININDNGNSGSGGPLTTSAAITLSISAVNDAPVNNIPASQTVQQDGSLVFSSGNGNAITVSDVDVGNNEMKVTLTAANGLLTLGSTAGLTLQNGSGSGDSTMTFLGTQAAINAALDGLIFTPNSGYNGSASVQIITTDQGFTGSGGTLSDTDTINIAVSANAPSITSITSGTANGVYGIGSTIFVNVNFNAAVTVDTTGGTPTLLLETGSVDRLATYVSGSGTDTLVFSYKVQSGDRNADLDYASTAALALNGSTIRDSGSNNAQLTLATPGTAGSLGDNASVIIDGVRPTATVVVSDTALRIGETSLVTVIFSEAVTGFTNADLTINNGTLSAVSSSDGGITWTATFTPTTNISDTTNIITLDNTGVTDAAGNMGTGTTTSNNYSIDTLRPTATVVVGDTALKAGETSLVTITFSEAVTGFTSADLTVSNGTLSSVSSADGGITWTA
ncbi:Ig-like domain-containing protein, partial [Kosakonia cowanii]